MLSEHLLLCLQSAVPLEHSEPGDAPTLGREGHEGFQSSFGTFGVSLTPALAATTSLGDTGGLGGDRSTHNLCLSLLGTGVLRLLVLLQRV